MNKPSFEMSADARLLLQRLRLCKIGETITYIELGRAISKSVDGTFAALRTALKRALKDDDMVFACIRGVGFKRLDHHEIVAMGAADADAIRRKARRSIQRQMKADFTQLSRDDQARWTAQVAVMGSVAMMTSERSIQRLAGATTPGSKELPIKETLRLFAGTVQEK